MRTVLLVAAALLLNGEVWATCAPEHMVKVVIRNATPGVDPHSFAAQPKTYYRLGTKYGRVEEVPDPAQGIHGLVIVNEPDMWMIDLVSMTGQHIIDTGAPYHFQAPALGLVDAPDFVKDLEIGCELEYMKQLSPIPPKSIDVGGETFDAYRAVAGEYALTLLIDPRTKKPSAASVHKSGKVVVFVRYVEYQADLPPDLQLFSPLKGVKYTEPKS